MLSDAKRLIDIDYVDKHFVPIERYNQLEKEIGELKSELEKEKEKNKELSNSYDKLAKECNEENRRCMLLAVENQDLKDKIKAKIEELEIEQESNREDLKIAIDNLLFQNIDKIGNKISINMSVREILQSLLEKE